MRCWVHWCSARRQPSAGCAARTQQVGGPRLFEAARYKWCIILSVFCVARATGGVEYSRKTVAGFWQGSAPGCAAATVGSKPYTSTYASLARQQQCMFAVENAFMAVSRGCGACALGHIDIIPKQHLQLQVPCCTFLISTMRSEMCSRAPLAADVVGYGDHCVTSPHRIGGCNTVKLSECFLTLFMLPPAGCSCGVSAIILSFLVQPTSCVRGIGAAQLSESLPMLCMLWC
jgi:hypothetical protein